MNIQNLFIFISVWFNEGFYVLLKEIGFVFLIFSTYSSYFSLNEDFYMSSLILFKVFELYRYIFTI